jgi:4-amino-4-deoxy-L-arabinose transferase-like glycosyltransferase
MSSSGRSKTTGRTRKAHGKAAPLPPMHGPTADVMAATAGQRLSAWLGRHRHWVLTALVVCSVALRAICFLQLNASPCIDLHRWDQTDMHYFDAWGKAIAGGDWLSASVGVPMHTWHKEVADRYLTDHPDVQTTLNGEAALGGAGTTASGLLWARWTGGHQFYQDPLHAYLTAATYALFGADPRYVLAWQLALGVWSNLLIFSLARRYFGEVAAAVAAALALACGPLMYYELLLLRDSTITFAGLGVVWLTGRAIGSRRWYWFAVVGAALGLASLLKSTFALLAVIVAAGVLLEVRDRRRDLVMSSCAMAAGFLLALAPLAVRNTELGVSPVALAGSGALTFATSNDVEAPASGEFFVPRGLGELLARSGPSLVPAVFETLRPHTVSSLIALAWRKLDNVWHWYEIPNNANFYYLRRHAPILDWMPVTFFALGPLSLAGLVMAARRARAAWPLYSLVGCHFAALMTFFVLGRLRVPMLAALIPFASVALVHLARARRQAAIAAVAVLALGLWTGRPLSPGQPLIGTTDWLTPFLAKYQFQVNDALQARDGAAATAAYLEFLRYEPDLSGHERAGDVLVDPSDRETARTFGQIHAVCAGLLREAGRVEDAQRQSVKAASLFGLAGERPR